MSLSLCYLVRSTFVPVVTRFSTSETTPWPLLLFSMFLLDVFLITAARLLDMYLVIVFDGTKSIGTKTLGVVRCFVMCVNLPKRRNIIIQYFTFLFSKGTSLCGFHILSSSLSLAKSSDSVPPCRRFVRNFYKFVSFLKIFSHIFNCLGSTSY